MHQTSLMYPGWVIATAGHGESSPPFLRLAGHPLRWRLLSEVARSVPGGGIATAGHGESSPPFRRLAGHPLRWRLLSELARSDRRVGELCALAGRAQSLVSYHLRPLREGGLVS